MNEQVWAIKTKLGTILNSTIRSTENNCINYFITNTVAAHNYVFLSWENYWQKKGWACVKITITEGWK